jgi:hypothetical protein
MAGSQERGRGWVHKALRLMQAPCQSSDPSPRHVPPGQSIFSGRRRPRNTALRTCGRLSRGARGSALSANDAAIGRLRKHEGALAVCGELISGTT